MIEVIGTYINRANNKQYSIEKHTHEVHHRRMVGSFATLEGSFEYKTSCGYNVTPRSHDLSQFELIEIDGLLHRLET